MRSRNYLRPRFTAVEYDDEDGNTWRGVASTQPIQMAAVTLVSVEGDTLVCISTNGTRRTGT